GTSVTRFKLNIVCAKAQFDALVTILASVLALCGLTEHNDLGALLDIRLKGFGLLAPQGHIEPRSLLLSEGRSVRNREGQHLPIVRVSQDRIATDVTIDHMLVDIHE